MKSTIHLNSDLGEGGKNDAAIMAYISSCNIACSGHYGTQQSIAKTLDFAQQNSVLVGAHPSYPDKENFGRKSISISSKELKDSLNRQIDLFVNEAEKKHLKTNHIKPHGALYNDIAKDAYKAEVVLEVIDRLNLPLKLVVPPFSVIQQMAQSDFDIWLEVFADRNYENDYSLVSRSKSNALITNKNEFVDRLVDLAEKQQIVSVHDKKLTMDFDTVCVHGDLPQTLENLKFAHQELAKKKISIL
ncbi:MAG: LamB/YcsF family protein [Bacteroidota bacterium]